MSKADSYSDEQVFDKSNELDLTDHHENITAGIRSIKRLYQCTLSDARKIVENSYIERISKTPRISENLQKQMANLKYQLISLPKYKKSSRSSFTLLKCCSSEGIGWASIEGYEKNLTLSFRSPKSEVQQNKVSEIACTIMTEKDSEICSYKLNIFERLSKIPVDQIISCKNITLFENFKNSEVDFCFCLVIELSNKDKTQVLRIKGRDTQKKIEKSRIDALGINIRKEFKSGCCDCFIN